MFKNLLKKALMVAALAGSLGFGMSFAACSVETDHPVVTISVEIRPETEFAQTYDLEYTLYRNMYPNTVSHFITLAENGFYDDTLIHDYQTADWFGGGYAYSAATYTENKSANALAEYFNNDEISKESSYMSLFESGLFKPTVYSWTHPDEVLPTLVGEFSTNRSPEIKNGKFTADVGVLKMYYYKKNTKDMVNVKFMDDEEYTRNYSYNCATSLFAIQVNSGTTVAGSDYCVFGKINNGNVLDEMVEAVTQSIGTDTISVSGVSVDNWESYSADAGDKGMTKSFRQASEPIVVRSVKVNKY